MARKSAALEESSDQKRSREIASYWKDQIKESEADPRQKHWKSRAKKIVAMYRQDRPANDTEVSPRKLNLFWSNTETQKPAIYSKTPQPIVERRFLDRDPIGKIASQILERALRYEMPSSGFHHSLKLVRDDYLLVGRGVPWVRYNPKFGESISVKQTAPDEEKDEGSDKEIESTEENQTEETTEQVESESLCVDYIGWDDFYILGRPRVWAETEALARKVYMGRYDLKKKFKKIDPATGKSIGELIPLDHSPGDNDDREGTRKRENVTGQQATIYEIWCKYEDKVYFIAKEYEFVCEEVENPLGLENFFPCPRPIFATTTNDTLVPVPDFVECRDQYLQINDLTRRIDVLTDACRVVGVYDSAAKSINRIFTEAKEPNLIPVDQWAMFAEKGGLKGSIDFIPIEMIAKTITQLVQIRRQVIEDLDRLTGVFDIMRGETDPNETKGAQQLKQQNGMGRLGERSDEFARLCRDTICIMGEIIAEHYDPKTLIMVSGAMQDDGLVPTPPTQPALQVLGPGMQPSAPTPTAAQPPQGLAPPGGQPVGAPMPQGAPPQAMNGGHPVPGPIPPQMPPSPPPIDPMAYKTEMIGKALELLKSEKLRGFRIDIETDSTIQPDANADKAAVNEFIASTTKFIETAGQISMQMPSFAPLAGKLLMFGARRYRVGRDLETAIEEFCDDAEKQAKEMAANPRPSPEMIKAEAEKTKAQSEIQRQQMENQGEQQNKQMQFMIDKFEASVSAHLKQMDMQIAAMKMANEEREHHRKGIEHERALERGAVEHARKLEEARNPPNNGV